MILTNQNYHSKESNQAFLSVSQYKNFMGTIGRLACEEQAMAILNEEWQTEKTVSLLVGSYVDAYFEGSLDLFKAENPEVFTHRLVENENTTTLLSNMATGYVTRNNTLVSTKIKEAKELYPECFTEISELKADYKKAEEIIKRVERDEFFMKYMSGEKQVIMTAEMFGANWKIKIDSYHPNVAIVDLKVMESLNKHFWTKDGTYMNFVGYWGYDLQLAIYQKVVEINTGKKLPCYIAAVSKEKETDIEIIQIEQVKMDEIMYEVKRNIKTIIDLKNGENEPIRCGVCDYCKHTKVLTHPIWSSELLGEI